MNTLPPPSISPISYTTAGGIQISRTQHDVDAEGAISELIDALDSRRGVLLSSGYDYPGRYSRWDLGFVDPPLSITARDRSFHVDALNERGRLLLSFVESTLQRQDGLERLDRVSQDRIEGSVRVTGERFTEEHRSRQPSVFSVLRCVIAAFRSDEDHHLGLYGAFGYDLCFQFEPIELKRPRPADQRDLVLYLPDNLVVIDRQKERAARFMYDFSTSQGSTQGMPRATAAEPYVPSRPFELECDHAPGEYAKSVQHAKEAFRRGDLFELVLSQTFKLACPRPPSLVFRHLQQHNPAPYALFLNLGEREYLVGASPEMYVRVEGKRIETCPISGTIARGGDPVEDAERIRELLVSTKEESELTMCTDVDRNDKSRICEPGSVTVLGRRQIELYSRLIHTVDHVEGTLRPEFDALDAFLSHTWAVTVTGAPKPGAIQRVENDEKSPRAWYGGAIGRIAFDGNLNTGLTLRTVRIKDGAAEVRAGATLLFDSEPEAEERETRIKASAFLDAVQHGHVPARAQTAIVSSGRGARVLLIDHLDSFVHTLANYLRQTGAEVVTLRAGFEPKMWYEHDPDLVVLSPGPGSPSEFKLSQSIEQAMSRRLPIFGVCLGLQGIVEHFGGELGVLDYPMHGKPSLIDVEPSPLFTGLSSPFRAGRYHSLFAKPEKLPRELKVTARSQDGVIMAIEHVSLPIAAVQFHPESLMSLGGAVGLRLLDNAVAWLRAHPKARRR
jgi:anthranilate synthase